MGMPGEASLFTQRKKPGLNRLLYWPICRAYARHIVRDKPADAIYRSFCALHFRRKYRFWPNFVHPRRFSEKLWSRMLHERDPLLTVVSDKLRVRDYVAGKVGPDYLIPLLWSGQKPEQVPFDNLPQKFVIKANHGCKYNIIVTDKRQLEQANTRRQLEQWLTQNYCLDFGLGTEWAYKNIKPSIIVETFLEESGRVPVDYKFWCFSGRVECVTLHFDRFQRHTVRTLDRDYKPYAYAFPLDDGSGECQRPANAEEMLRVAESLAEGFDFMRVDLYNLQGRIFFGEMTPYPLGIYPFLLPARLDYALAEKWKSK
jgi:hypothetical protein